MVQSLEITKILYKCTDRCQIPDGDGTGLATDDECPAVLQQLHRANVVITLLVTRHNYNINIVISHDVM